MDERPPEENGAAAPTTAGVAGTPLVAGPEQPPELLGKPPERPELPPRYPFFELIYAVLFKPTLAFKSIAAYRPVGSAFLVKYRVYLFTFLMSIAIGKRGLAGYFPGLDQNIFGLLNQLGIQVLIGFGVLGLIGLLVGWFLKTAIYSLMAEFWGGQARGISLFCALGFAALPGVFVPPLQLVGYLLGGSAQAIGGLDGFGAGIWGLILNVLALREAAQISTGRAVAVLLTLIGMVVIFVLLMAGIMLASLLPLLRNLPDLPGRFFPPI